MTLTERMTALGFDLARLKFGLRTAFAACLALLLAWLLGLEHPQWSAMTVWAASQPLRGQLLEKSFFRALGTLVGVGAGVALVVISHDKPAILVVGLSLWIGLCAGLGNVQRGFVSYGTMLAGYSAAMVALLETGHPDHIVALGLDRLLTVLVGVLVALVIGWLLTPQRAEQAVAERVRRLTARVLDDMAKRVAGTPTKIAEEQQAILSEMAAIEETLDPHSAGSLRSRQAVRAIRSLLTSEVAALLWLRRVTVLPVQSEVSAALAEAAHALATSAQDETAIASMEKAADLASSSALREVILTMETALRDQLGLAARDQERPQTRPPVILHRDWIGAREALIRAAGSMLVVGALWLVTGFSTGAFLLLGTAIMMSIFSTFDNPTQTMRFVILGQVFGAAGALACRWLAWPFAGNDTQLVLLIMPFVMLGAFLFSHRRTTAASFDYNMVMLLLLKPAFPLTETFNQSLAIAAAVIAGPSTAYLAYRLIFPVTARRRMDTLIAMMVHELQNMAAATDAAKNRPVWRARLYYRLLRLVRWTEKTGEKKLSVTDGSLAVLQVGSAILRIQDLLRQPGINDGTTRSLTAVLRRMRNVAREPDRARRALDLAAARLKREGRAEAEQIYGAARALAASLVFFHRAARNA